MNAISEKDRQHLRNLARRQVELAHSEANAVILAKWRAQAAGLRETPTVRFPFSNFSQEIIDPQMLCEGETARQLERQLLLNVSGQLLFDDDTPIGDTLNVHLRAHVSPFSLKPHVTYSGEGKGFHIDPVMHDIDADIERLAGGDFAVDHDATQRSVAIAEDVFGDILRVRTVMDSLPGGMTSPIVFLMGMENYYLAMYDSGEALHRAMDMACGVYERFFDHLEATRSLLPTNGFSPVGQETYAFTDELPANCAEKTTDCWGFLESQETTAVSPATFGEFVFPYQDRLVKRFGLLSYGCCERVDVILPDYLLKWGNLRKLSVSPFNDEHFVGECLRGGRIVYYSKPRAEQVTNPGPLNESVIREYFKGVCRAAEGCMLEVAQREVNTIYGDPNRGKTYVRLLKESIAKYWKP